LPSAGKLDRFRFPDDANVRIDSALGDVGEVSPYYDSLLAKVIVHAPTRAEAARRLSRALARAQIHGLRTNRELLVRVLEHPEFLSGQTDTHFLERHDAADLSKPLGDERVECLHAAAAALAAQASRRNQAAMLSRAPSGWRNNPSQPQQTRFRGEQGEITVEYEFRRAGLWVRVNGQELSDVKLTAASPDQVRLQVDGVEHTYDVHHLGDHHYVDSPLGTSTLTEIPRFALPEEATAAGSLAAPLPGVVIEIKIKPGDTVAAGDPLLVIDSMKVHHWIAASTSGAVTEVRVEQGQHVAAGAVLVVIEEALEK
jgi:acetyl/propionyl-CoA carboxylase alpha subunit